MVNTISLTEKWVESWKSFLINNPVLSTTTAPHNFHVPDEPAIHLAENENFWADVSKCFSISDKLINLNNGAVCSSPQIVEEAYTSYYSLVNTAPSYYIWKVMEPGREIIREGLANLLNCSKDEVAVFRNATEALNNAIFGIELKAGDEIVACKQDYAKTISSWKQRELRDQIKIVWIDIDGTESNEEVIKKYVSAFSSKTRVVQITHVINWNGQVLPAKEIIKEAKARNILTILDAAHSFGILETDVTKLDCDYLGTALHKWLSGPIPSGMLFIKKDIIAKTWPLASAVNPLSDNIRKFEELSIQLLPNVISLGYAIEFHLRLGRINKEARLRHLRKYWTDQVKNIASIKFNTPLSESQCAVIVNLSLKKWEPVELENALFQKFKIHVTAVLWPNMDGIRVTPNIYTSKGNLDKFVAALKTFC